MLKKIDIHIKTGQFHQKVLHQNLKKLKELKKSLFFKGIIYKITFNKESEYSQSKMALIFDIPSEEYLTNWHKIKILVAPNGLKEILFDNNTTK